MSEKFSDAEKHTQTTQPREEDPSEKSWDLTDKQEHTSPVVSKLESILSVPQLQDGFSKSESPLATLPTTTPTQGFWASLWESFVGRFEPVESNAWNWTDGFEGEMPVYYYPMGGMHFAFAAPGYHAEFMRL